MTHPLFHYGRQIIGMIFSSKNKRAHYFVPEYNAGFLYIKQEIAVYL